jgi:drug/metabolite transporter (DMT)-like permease
VSGAALALVLAAAVIHAAWNRMLHGAADRLAAAAVGSVIGAVLLLPATVTLPPVRVWPLVLASGAAEAAYFSFLSAAYRRGELSFTYPVARGIAPFLITLGGWLVLSQSLTAARLLGSLALGAGLVIISHAGLAAGRGVAIAFAAVTGLTIATYSVIDADAVRSAAPIGYLGAATMVQAVILLALTKLDWRRLRGAARDGAGVGIGSLAAYLLVLLAYQRAPASPVATLRELSILFGILLARERPGWRVWLGGVLCMAGAALTVL